MVLQRFSEAVADLGETLRRVFSAPGTHSWDPGMAPAEARAIPGLEAAGRGPEFLLQGRLIAPELALRPGSGHASLHFEGRLRSDEGLARWAAGATICEIATLDRRGALEVAIPPLPRRAACRRLEMGGFQTRSRAHNRTLDAPGVRGGLPALGPVASHRALDLALGLPISVPGRAVQDLPKPQWMRFSLQLVKATGENIRNLEVLGLYRIPARGVASMRHDARSGCLMIQLSAEAAGAPRLPFLLARRKDDRSLVSCFLEEG